VIEGTIIMQDVSLHLGKLETPAKNGDDVYAMTMTDPSGLSVTVLWNGPTLAQFIDSAKENVGGVIQPKRPKLEIARTLPKERL
jgi:hypothetical protein